MKVIADHDEDDNVCVKLIGFCLSIKNAAETKRFTLSLSP